MFALKLILGLLMLVGSACAQQANLEGLEFGQVWDGATNSLRRLMGFPGAAYLGPRTAEGLRGASVSPAGDWLYWTVEGATLVTSVTNREEIAVGAIRQAGWCAADTFFILPASEVEASTTNWQWWRKNPLTGHYAVFAEIPAPDPGPVLESLQAVCRSQDSSLFVAGPSGIQQFQPVSHSVRQIAEGQYLHLALDQAQLVAVDSDAAQIHRWEEREGQWQPQSWFGQPEVEDRVSAVGLVEWKRELKGVLVAYHSPTAPKLFLYSLDGAEVLGQWPLDAQPTRIEPLPTSRRSSRFFLLNQRQSLEDFLEIVEFGAEANVFFVPELVSSNQDGSQ